MLARFLALLVLFLAGPALAGSPTWSIDPSGSPRNVYVRDLSNGSDVPIGAINTSTHTWAPAFASQSANTFLAAPDGSAGVPSFRATVAADIAAALGATANSPGWLWPQQQFFGQGNPSSNKLKTYAYGDQSAPGVFLNPTQGAGVTGAGWTSLNTAGSNISIGAIGFGFADGSGAEVANAAWGLYGECRGYASSTGYCHAMELDATNLRASTIVTRPYSALAAGFNGGLHIASGGGCVTAAKCYNPANGLFDLTARQASYALLIGTNTANFDTGINFQCGSIGTTDCVGGGSGEAIRLYSGLSLKWYAPSDVSTFTFGMSASTTLVGQLAWSNSGLTLQGGGGGILHQFYAGATDVNGIALLSAATSASPSIGAQGSDTNIDTTITAKGTGKVKTAAPFTTTSTVTASQILTNGAVPTISTCGTSPPVASTDSNANGGEFTLGTGSPTACTVTFAVAYPTNAFCTVTPSTNYTGTYYLSARSNVGFTVTLGTGTSSAKFNYACNGH